MFKKDYLDYRLSPWLKHFGCAKSRCNNKKQSYFKNGIKLLIEKEDMKYLWFRDQAFKLNRPSLDRINTEGHYCIENCRFIELDENRRRPQSKGVRKNKYKGVTWQSDHKKWRAFIKVGGKQKHIGYFSNQEDAALAFNTVAIQIFNSNAVLNKIEV